VGHQKGCLESLAFKLNEELAPSIAEFLRQVAPVLYGSRAGELMESFVALLGRLQDVAPEPAQAIAREVLAGGRPPWDADYARLRGGLEGRIFSSRETVANALRSIATADHLERMTATATLAFSQPGQHAAIFDRLLSANLQSLDDSVRTSMLDVAGDIGRTQPERLLEFVSACPWPVNAGGGAWRKIADCLAERLPREFKAWLLAGLDASRHPTRMTIVGICQLIAIDPGMLTEGEILRIFDGVLTADMDSQRTFVERTGAIACAAPQLASRILAEWARPRHCILWGSLAYSLKGCMNRNPNWVLQEMPTLIAAAQSRYGHGLISKLFEALLFWPEEQRPSLIGFMEEHLTASLLAAFPQEKCQVEFLMLVQWVARSAPARAFGLLKRAVIQTAGSAGAAAVATANIVAHLSDESILAEALDHLLQVAFRGNQRHARHSLHRGLRSIDDKLGARRVIGRFFDMYRQVEDDDALRFLIGAVHCLPSWRPEDTSRLSGDTQRITGELRSYLLGRY
jgi:hypothetical protein